MSNAIRVHHGMFGRMAVLDMTRPLVVHAHPQAHILFKIGGVDAQFSVREQAVTISGQQAVLINSWEPHAYHHPATDGRMQVLALYLDPAWLAATTLRWASCSRFESRAMPMDGITSLAVKELSSSLIFNSMPHFDAVEQAVLSLVRRAQAALPALSDPAAAAAPKVDRRLARCLQYMHENLDEREDLEQLGLRFGLSRPHLFFLFQRTFQLTPNVYWNTLRMEYAVDQLRCRRQSIGSIAQHIGFCSQSNFTRFFQNIQGVGPRDYQAAMSRLPIAA